MCDVQGETRILHQSNGNPGVPALAPSRSTPNTPTSLRRAPSLEKCFHDSEFFKKQLERQHRRNGELKNHRDQRRSASSNRGEAQQQQITESINEQEIDTKQREKPHDSHLFDNKNETVKTVPYLKPPMAQLEKKHNHLEMTGFFVNRAMLLWECRNFDARAAATWMFFLPQYTERPKFDI
ncbi:hypothetical protein TKK_0007758 [Trichogramma kaykai]